MSNPAMHSRLAKERSPEKYCPKCLWRLSSGPCPRHMNIAGQAIAPSKGEPETSAPGSLGLARTPHLNVYGRKAAFANPPLMEARAKRFELFREDPVCAQCRRPIEKPDDAIAMLRQRDNQWLLLHFDFRALSCALKAIMEENERLGFPLPVDP